MKKIFILIAVLLLALLIAAAIYAQSDLFSGQIRPFVLAPLQEILGNDARIGKIRASLVPLSVEARDISLPDEKGGEAAAIRKIKIYINPLPLLLKKIRLPSIVLLEPRIYAERSGDGAFNLTPLINRIRANIEGMQGNTASSYSLLLKTITVNQGSMVLVDDMTGTRCSMTSLHATARVNLGGDSFALTLKNSLIRLNSPAYPEITGDLKAALRYEHQRLSLDSFDLATGDTAVSLSGTIGSLPDPDLNLKVKARSGPQTIGKFKKILKYLKKESKSHIEASATVKGNFKNPKADGLIKFSGLTYQGLLLQDAALSFGFVDKQLIVNGETWKLSRDNKSIMVESINIVLSSSANGLDIRRFSIEAGDLSIALSGRADPQRGYDAVLTADSRDKGQTLSFLTSVPTEGSISVKGYLTGIFNQPLLDGTFTAASLSVRGILFDNAAGRIQFRDNTISLASVDIQQNTSRYFFNGSVDFAGKEPLFAARLKVLRSDVTSIVALFYPKRLPLHLSATGDLSFNGTARDFTGSGRLALESGSAYGETFTKGIVTASLTTERIIFSQVFLNKGSGTVTGTGWIGFDGTYSAAVESRDVRLGQVNLLTPAPVDGAFNLVIESSGSFSRPVVKASLEMDDFLLNQTGLGAVSAGLQIADKTLRLKAKQGDDSASLTASLSLDKPFRWNAQAAISTGMFDPFLLLEGKELAGRVTMNMGGVFSASGNGTDSSTLVASASLRELGFTVGDYRIDSDGAAILSVQGDKLHIAALNLSGPGTKIAMTGNARVMQDLDLSFTGTVNLALLRPVFRHLEHADGIAEVKLGVYDSWKNPEVAGEIVLRNGEIKIKDIPHKFSSLAGELIFDKSSIVIESLTGEIGGGSLTASGKAEIAGAELRNFSTQIAFENVTVRYPEGLGSTFSGDLYYDGDASEQSLAGDVSIKRARYDKRVEWKSMLVDIGKGFHQKKKAETGLIGDTALNIRFYGKENILFQNNLAKMPLDVDVFLRGTVNRPQLLGRIEVRKGSVYFRQNEFKILHGSVDFVDPNRMNPVLDIQAEIQVREYLVRMAVSGTADRAVVTLLSDPQLTDSDILTLLALGKRGTELKGGIGTVEAASFATGQFQDIIESRARSLTGLDRFQVDPYISKGDTSVPRITVGKEIVPNKLYATYSSNVGAATPEQIFRIEYILNRNFSLIGEHEQGKTGADIKYRFEFR